MVRELGITEDTLQAVAEHQELERRERIYWGQRPRPDLTGKVLIVVDDGLATGATMRAAVAAIRRQQPARVVVAVPVGAASTCQQLEQAADEVVCASTPALFVAVGQAYRDFAQTTDEEVRALLDAARTTNADQAAEPDRVKLPGVATGHRGKQDRGGTAEPISNWRRRSAVDRTGQDGPASAGRAWSGGRRQAGLGPARWPARPGRGGPPAGWDAVGATCI